MSRRRIRILPIADADVDDIALFIARDGMERAMKFYDAAYETFRLIHDHPLRWPLCQIDDPRFKDIRRRSILGFPNHFAFYRIDGDLVVVMRVMHGARDLPNVFFEED